MRIRAKGVWSTWLQLRSPGQHGILSALGCVPRREEIRFGVAVSGVHGSLISCHGDTFQALKQVVSRPEGVGDVCFFFCSKANSRIFRFQTHAVFPDIGLGSAIR